MDQWATSMRLIAIGQLKSDHERDLCLCRCGPDSDGLDVSGASLSLAARYFSDTLGYTDALSNGFA